MRPLRDSTAGVFVSIYLILLAFFVVLNAISNQHTAKAAAAMESVNSTFKKDFAAKASLINLTQDVDTSVPNDEFVHEAEGMLASVLQLKGRYSTLGGNVLKVNMPVTLIFPTGSATLRLQQAEFLDQLVSLVKASRQGERRIIEFVFGTGNARILAGNDRGQRLALNRAAAFGAVLRSRDLPEEAIMTGIDAIPLGDVRVTFYTRYDDIIPLRGRGEGAGK